MLTICIHSQDIFPFGLERTGFESGSISFVIGLINDGDVTKFMSDLRCIIAGSIVDDDDFKLKLFRNRFELF